MGSLDIFGFLAKREVKIAGYWPSSFLSLTQCLSLSHDVQCGDM